MEHLLLHVLICKYPAKDKMPFVDVGIGGVVNFIVPELNDVYSGWVTVQSWRRTCHEKIINDKDVYLAILTQFMEDKKNDPRFDILQLFKSSNFISPEDAFEKDEDIFKEIYKRAIMVGIIHAKRS